ncbi:low molecular weight phosphatase family protein [Rudaeicoccus suwonensis]|uniref:Protein-tyrosine phosphatase n=1 Tax=Rudaeicoccus suwonensis TaxID=657409 RepID=A0A561E2T8_9MICO|nr:low molecular weight phosphatase family protein [Rudaeicoccus suwonensis]TWE09928.1 protein-tyrosine phosphatase [Rudaeicoccus suwonensis]
MPLMLFVCTGNICRSPFAERYAAHLYQQVGQTGWEFASAGVGALTGSGIDQFMAAELRARGVDDSGFASRQLTPAVMRTADLIVGMETAHRTYVLEEFPAFVRHTFTLVQLAKAVSAADPHEHGADLVSSIGAYRPRLTDDDDVADPYQRGPEVAARTAEHIAELLDRLIPRLLV